MALDLKTLEIDEEELIERIRGDLYYSGFNFVDHETRDKFARSAVSVIISNIPHAIYNSAFELAKRSCEDLKRQRELDDYGDGL